MGKRGERGAAIAVSAAAHLAALALLALSAPMLRLPTALFAPDIAVTLTRAPILLRRRSSAAAAPRAASIAASQPQAARRTPMAAVAPAKTAAAPSVSPPTVAQAAPTPPTTGAATATGAAAASATGRDWTVRPEDGDARGAARAAIGCGHAEFLKLTTQEQAACTRKLGDVRGLTLPRFDAIPADKRGYYDAVVAAYAKMHAGTPLPYTVAGPGANFGTTERWFGPPGAHMPGFGCKIPLGVPKGWKPPRGGPPHSVKLGPLPCYVTPPSGFLTEEADVPSAVDLPARK